MLKKSNWAETEEMRRRVVRRGMVMRAMVFLEKGGFCLFCVYISGVGIGDCEVKGKAGNSKLQRIAMLYWI